LHAIAPSSGPTTATPRATSAAMFACVAGCCHIRTFIAGATSTRLSVASNNVDARSSASPAAIFARMSAEAGATTVGQIADRLDVSSPFVTAEVGRLERRQLVEKRPNTADGRSNLIVLTDLGRVMAAGPNTAQANGAPVEIVWDQGIWGGDNWEILAGTPNADACRQFINVASEPKRPAALPDSRPAPTTGRRTYAEAGARET